MLYETFFDDKSSTTLYFKPLMFQCFFVTAQTRKHEDRLIAVIDRLTTHKEIIVIGLSVMLNN